MSTTASTTGKRRIPLGWLILCASGLVVTAISLTITVPMMRQRSAIRQIEAFGGEIVQDPVELIWLRDWIGEDAMQTVKQVELIIFKPDEDTYVARYPGLILSFGRGNPWTDGQTIDDTRFGIVAEFPRLKGLHADWTNLSDTGLKHIAGLSELEELYLDGTDVSDASFSLLTSFRRLKELHLAHTKFGEAKLAALRSALPACKVVTRPAVFHDPDPEKMLEFLEESTSGMGGGMF